MSGLGPDGFEAKSEAEVLSEIATAQRATISARLNVAPSGLIGAMNRSYSRPFAELWTVAKAVYDARDPKNATAAAADAVSQITGTMREAAERGLVELSVRLGPRITLPAGHIAHVDNEPTNRWRTTAAATNPTNAPADVLVPAECTQLGAIVADAGTIAVIATPFNGWLSVTNPLDAGEGRASETDAELLARREVEVSRPGTATIAAIAADLADVEVDGVKVVHNVLVEHNTSAFYDQFKRPPHSIECVVQFTRGLSGDPLTAARKAIAEELFRTAGAGLLTYGAQSATVTDALGTRHTMRWTEPSETPVYISCVLSVAAGTYVGNAAVIDALLAYGDTLKLGADVKRYKLTCLVIDLPGVLDVVTLNLGRNAGAMRASNASIGRRNIARFDTSRITVTTT